jgi:ERCC4-related helicase/dsRNA-specific ribonuclease
MIRSVDGKCDGNVPEERKLNYGCEDEHQGKIPSPQNPSPHTCDESYRTFFLADPVTDAEVAATRVLIYERMDRILCELEAGGVEVFKAYLQNLQSHDSDKEVRSRSAALQDLEDSTVCGSPRDYQSALLEIAKTRNTIIHLGTGKGKTLIALLCIRHFAAPPSDVDQPKQTLFLVPSVALAVQQSAALRANLPYSVAMACWNVAHQSRLLLRRANVLVATHGAIYDLLMHYGDLFSFRNFNLVVLDECHYAVGNHQYKIIMDKWYHTLPQDQRPHILGLTASPLTNVKHTHSDEQLSRMLTSLEQTLDSKLVTWNATDSEDASAALESQVLFEPVLEAPRHFPSHDRLDIHKCRPRELMQLLILYQDLGPLPVSLYVQTVMKEISCNVYEKETAQQFHCLLTHLQAIVCFCQKQTKRQGPRGGRSDKLLKLEALVKEQLKSRDDSVGLVFVQRRVTAMALYNYFCREGEVDEEIGDQKVGYQRAYEPVKLAILDNFDEAYEFTSAVSDPPEENQRVEVHGGSSAFDFESRSQRSSQAPPFRPRCEDVSPNYLVTSKKLTLKTLGNDDGNQFADADADELFDAFAFESEHLRPAHQKCCIQEPMCGAECAKARRTPTLPYIPDQFCDAFEEELLPAKIITIPDQFCDAVENEAFLPSKVLFSPDHFCSAAEENNLHTAKVRDIPDQLCDAVEQIELRSNASSFLEDQFCDAVEDEELPLVNKREIPTEVCDCFEAKLLPAPNESLRCGVLVRRATQIFKYLNASNHVVLGDGSAADSDPEKEWLHQVMQIRSTLSALRKKEINLLVATSIVEEGVDVQACSFVAVFDAANSVKAYIQMKGRARRKDAKFFLFSQESSTSESLWNLQLSQQRIETFIKQQQDEKRFKIPIPLHYTSQKSIHSLSDEQRAVEECEYRAEHGTVDLKSAKSLLNRYILKIPVESMVRATKDSFLLHMPKFGEDELILPAHLPLGVRVVSVPHKYRELNKRRKHQIMALMACVRLHKLKLLNERLLPLGKMDLTLELLRVGKTQTQISSPNNASVKSLFADGRISVFLYPIIQTGDTITKVNRILKSGSRSLVLISSERISVKLDCMRYHHRQLGHIECELGNEIATTFDEFQWELSVRFFSILLDSRWRKKTRGQRFHGRESRHDVIAPITIGLLTIESEVDWKGMQTIVRECNRSSCERESACRMYDEQLPIPRLCHPSFQAFSSYIILGPTSLDCSAPFPAKSAGGASTFQEHYKVAHNYDIPSNETLFVAHRLWRQPSVFRSCTSESFDSFPEIDLTLPEGLVDDLEMCTSLPTVLLPRVILREARLADPTLSLLSIVLPQLLYTLERQLLVDSFLRCCLLNFPVLGTCLEKLPWAKVSVALTAKSANLDVDYEQYEWLGDGVLKLLQSDALLRTPKLRCWVKHLHEGDLTILRSAMSNNEYLAAACRRVGFQQYVLTTPLARGEWVPRQLESYSRGVDSKLTRRAEAKAGMKVCADVIESILGLIFIHFGFEAATSVGLECGVLLPIGSGINLEDFIRPYFVPRADAYDAARLATGRGQFNYPPLVEEAFTHPSAVHEAVPSYQKLEWIGDAVLCIAVREWIFRTFPMLPVGDMATVDAALVSNEVIGYQCFRTGLHKFINHRDETIPSRLEYYEWSISEGGRALWGSDPPKMLPDVVEALLGAAHMDGGFAAGQLAVKTLIGPVLDAVESLEGDASKLSHPISKLNRMAGHLVQIDLQREDAFLRKHGRDSLLWEGNGWRRGSIDGSESTATVSAMGQTIISAVDPSWKVARNRACSLAVAVLEKHPELVRRWKEITGAIDRDCCGERSKSVGKVDTEP